MQSSTEPTLLPELLEEIVSWLPTNNVLAARLISKEWEAAAQQVLFQRTDPYAVTIQKDLLPLWARNPAEVKVSSLILRNMQRAEYVFFDRLTVFPPTMTDDLFNRLITAASGQDDHERDFSLKVFAAMAPYLQEEQSKAVIALLEQRVADSLSRAMIEALLAFDSRLNDKPAALAAILRQSHLFEHKKFPKIPRRFVQHYSREEIDKLFETQIQLLAGQDPEKYSQAFRVLQHIFLRLNETQKSILLSHVREKLDGDDENINTEAVYLLLAIPYPTLPDEHVLIFFNLMLRKMKMLSDDIGMRSVCAQMLEALAHYLTREQVNQAMRFLIESIDLVGGFELMYFAKALTALASHMKIPQSQIKPVFKVIIKQLNVEAISRIGFGTDLLDSLIAFLPYLSKKRMAIVLRKLEQLLSSMHNAHGPLGGIVNCFRILAGYLTKQHISALCSSVKNGIENGNDVECYCALQKLLAIGEYLSPEQLMTLWPGLQRALRNSDFNIVGQGIYALNAPRLNHEQIAEVFPMLIHHLSHAGWYVRCVTFNILFTIADRLHAEQVNQLITALGQLQTLERYGYETQLFSQLIVLGKCSLAQLTAANLPVNLMQEWVNLFAQHFESATKLPAQPSFARSRVILFQSPQQQQDAMVVVPVSQSFEAC